jgi:hypothetical protein
VTPVTKLSVSIMPSLLSTAVSLASFPTKKNTTGTYHHQRVKPILTTATANPPITGLSTRRIQGRKTTTADQPPLWRILNRQVVVVKVTTNAMVWMSPSNGPPRRSGPQVWPEYDSRNTSIIVPRHSSQQQHATNPTPVAVSGLTENCVPTFNGGALLHLGAPKHRTVVSNVRNTTSTMSHYDGFKARDGAVFRTQTMTF